MAKPLTFIDQWIAAIAKRDGVSTAEASKRVEIALRLTASSQRPKEASDGR